MKKKSLLIVASLAYDGIETKENKVDNILDGAGTYICLSVKHFDNNCSIISVVGNDFKDHDLKLLESCGVDISGIKIEQNDKTFYWSCIYTDNFKERIIHVHCKDMRKNVLEKSLKEDFSFRQAFLEGAFTVPGDGLIDYEPLLTFLKKNNYNNDTDNVINNSIS